MLKLILIFVAILSHQNSNNRVLDIYTKSADNTYYRQQLLLLNADKPGLVERNIVIKTHIIVSKTAALYKKKRLNGDFTITLTGKDGGEKMRETEPITLKKLYSTIDAMPMRKSEMKP